MRLVHAGTEMNSWEELRLDLEDEHRRVQDLEDQLAIVEQIDSTSAELLRHIFEDERKHREEMTDMLIRSDPQAFLAT
jgi:bacterioferritin (cytochrome b1)